MRTYYYLEVKAYNTGEVVKRMDLTDKSNRTRDLTEQGLNRQLNHKDYYTFSFESETKLESI